MFKEQIIKHDSAWKSRLRNCCKFIGKLVNKTTSQHPWSLHGSTPVIRGEKYACNLWFRQGQRFKMKTPFDKSKNE